MFGHNTGGFLWIGSESGDFLTGGIHKITRCLFQHAVNSLSNYLDNNSTWLIGGNAGSGKTNLISNIAESLQARQAAVLTYNSKIFSLVNLETKLREDFREPKLSGAQIIEQLN